MSGTGAVDRAKWLQNVGSKGLTESPIAPSWLNPVLTGAYVPMNTKRMSITPKAIQDLLDELEASKQSRLRAWNALQRLRSVLSEAGNIAISPGRSLLVGASKT
jgi:hypothetical protein